MSLPIIQSLWIGDSLSTIEQLCINSFLKNNHEFHLYIYDDIKNIPEGTIVKDGNDILDRNKIFTYNNGRVSGFANWFRLELLKKFGGFWVDLDVICLKPFDFPNNEPIYGLEIDDIICNAVLSFPRNHNFLDYMIDINKQPNRFLPYDDWSTKKIKFRRKLKGHGLAETGWGEISGPTGMSRALKHLNLLNKSKPKDFFFPIHYSDWKLIYYSSIKIEDKTFENTYAIHLWNEMTRKMDGFDKNATFSKSSLIEQLKSKYL